MKTSQFKKQYHNYTRANPSRKSVPPLEKHSTHQVEIRPGTTKHAAKYWCLDCNKWIAWLSLKEAIEAEKQGLINFNLEI